MCAECPVSSLIPSEVLFFGQQSGLLSPALQICDVETLYLGSIAYRRLKFSSPRLFSLNLESSALLVQLF